MFSSSSTALTTEVSKFGDVYKLTERSANGFLEAHQQVNSGNANNQTLQKMQQYLHEITGDTYTFGRDEFPCVIAKGDPYTYLYFSAEQTGKKDSGYLITDSSKEGGKHSLSSLKPCLDTAKFNYKAFCDWLKESREKVVKTKSLPAISGQQPPQ